MAEIKKGKTIGILVAVILLAGGYYFLKDSRLLVNEYEYYAYFRDVQGLQQAALVEINGVRVGKIAELGLNHRSVKVTISVKENIKLPEGTIASLAPNGITGDKIIELTPGPGPGMLPEHATLITTIDSSLLPVSVRFTPVFETFKYLMRSADTAFHGFNDLISTGLISKSAVGFINLETKAQGIARASVSLNNRTGSITRDLDKTYRKTTELAAKNSELNSSISSFENKTSDLSKKNISQNIKDLHTNISSLAKSFRKMDTSVEGFGKLVNMKSTYESITRSTDTLNRNMREYQTAPPGFSIFGGKKK